MRKGKKLAVLLFTFLFPCMTDAGIKDDVARTIVRVRSGNKYSTGFFWRNGSNVITTLHSLSATTNIEVWIPRISDWRRTNIRKVFKDGDLLLLEVINYASPDYLSASVLRPPTDTKGFTVGYHLGSPSWIEKDLSVGLSQGNRLTDLLPPASKEEIRKLGFPNLQTEIVYLKTSLLHGFSGAPIVDNTGRLIGVADGGLENGAAAISWCISSAYMPRLESSTEILPQLNQLRINTLFAVEDYTPKSENYENEFTSIGNFRFRKIKRRTFAQLDLTGKYSSMDALGLSQLLFNFSYYNYRDFEYDVYLEEVSGANIVIPSGGVIYQENGMLLSGTMKTRLYAYIALTPDIQQESVNFEWGVMPNYSTSWMADQAWSYPAPYPGPNNSGIRRRAYSGYGGTQYLFEALAAKSPYFLGVAAKRNNLISTNSYEDLQNWARYAIAIQLTSFSN